MGDWNQRKYLSWKRKNITLRGMKERYSENGSGARFGDGLYTAFLGNMKMAKGYGEVYYVLNAIPKKPVIVRDTNDAEIYIQRMINNWCKERGLGYDTREFYSKTNIRETMLANGFDGLVVKGREMVNYTPEDIKYFQTENQLIMYYEDFVEKLLSESAYTKIDAFDNKFDQNRFSFIMRDVTNFRLPEMKLKAVAAINKAIANPSSLPYATIEPGMLIKIQENIKSKEPVVVKLNQVYYLVSGQTKDRKVRLLDFDAWD